MKYSYLSQLNCPRCEACLDADDVNGLCACGSPLLAQYDLASLKRDVRREELTSRSPDLWRYHELLPLRSPESVVTLGEATTPLLPLARLASMVDLESLWVKDESRLPSGTFKARGAAVGVSKAYELGIRRIAMATNGNAGAAWSQYAARSGMKATIVMPRDAPPVPRAECDAVGAELMLIDGHIGDAGKVAAQVADRGGYLDVGTLKEPYRLEGKKTMGLEILEQLNWTVPDVIVYPAGGGVGLIGIFKAVREARDLGWIPQKTPRFVAVQAAGCAPIVRAWQAREPSTTIWRNPHTLAFGLNVPKPRGDWLALNALYESGGCAIAVSDEAILDAQRAVGAAEGMFVCPEGAATIAGLRELRRSGWIAREEVVVAINTGAGTKYPYHPHTSLRKSSSFHLAPDSLHKPPVQEDDPELTGKPTLGML